MLTSKLDRRRVRARDIRAMTRGTVSFIFVPQILERMIAELTPQQRERVKLRAEELVALHRNERQAVKLHGRNH